MKTKIYQPLTDKVIPDGEGFIALISFMSSHSLRGLKLSSHVRDGWGLPLAMRA
jgi:hypothetical protein